MLIAGAGVAGIAAALAAARRGCRVLLVERGDSLGGIATGGAVGAICGLFSNSGDQPGELLNKGVSREVVQALLQKSPASFRKTGKVFTLPFTPADLEELLLSLCRREQQLSILFRAFPTSVSVNNDIIDWVTISADSGFRSYSPKVLIDATGNGDLSCMAGADHELTSPDELQLAGFTITVTGIAAEADSLSLKVPFAIAGGVASGAVPALFRLTVYLEGERPGIGVLKVNIPDRPENRNIFREAGQIVSYLAGVLDEFRTARITATSKGVYSREGRRVTGLYRLTGNDVLSAAKFPGAVVRGAWPLEIWKPGRGVTYRYPPDGDYYEIPGDCLKVAGFSNLFLAGRCISVTHDALGSTRVIGTCLALGEQAGIAAAEEVKKGDFQWLSR